MPTEITGVCCGAGTTGAACATPGVAKRTAPGAAKTMLAPPIAAAVATNGRTASATAEGRYLGYYAWTLGRSPFE